MSITKNVLLNWYSSMKKNEKDSKDFWHRNLTLKVKFCHFGTSPLHQFSKFNNLLWICWFICKNLSKFVPPAWKLDNPYYHSIQPQIALDTPAVSKLAFGLKRGPARLPSNQTRAPWDTWGRWEVAWSFFRKSCAVFCCTYSHLSNSRRRLE